MNREFLNVLLFNDILSNDILLKNKNQMDINPRLTAH